MGSYAALWGARLQMMRLGNGVMAAVGVLVGILLAPAPRPEAGVWLAAAVAALFVTAFGNVTNDITDRSIDARAHPGRPIPSGRIGLRDAQAFAVLLAGFGLLESWVAGGTFLLAFAAVNVALLLAYERWLKRMAVLGNVAVAGLVASTFAFGAVAAGTGPTDWGVLWIVLALMLLTNLGRELLKDLQDAGADTGRRTFPQVFGAQATLASVQVVAVGVFALALWLMLEAQGWPTGARGGVAFTGMLFLPVSASAYRSVRQAQVYYKVAMLAALVALVWAGLG